VGEDVACKIEISDGRDKSFKKKNLLLLQHLTEAVAASSMTITSVDTL
jgi:hypothetical protein